MERSYKFTDYYTLASTNDLFPKPEVCFGHIMSFRQVDTIYLYIAKNKDYGFSRKLRHNFTLSFIELKKLIRLVKSIYPFKYKITSITHNKEEYYKIKLTFENFNKASVLFVLTALRYSYEFPFNVICSDAFKLMQISNFQNRGFFNICNFIFRIFFNDSERTVHSLCNDHVSKTKKSELMSRVQKLDRVHSLFNYDHFKDKGEHLNELPDFDQEKYNQDFWDNNFNARYNIYINNINNFNKK
jgi:hypothetical protein